MTFNDWHVYSRDPNGVRQGEIDDFLDLELIPTYCDVGTWSMSLNANALQADNMMLPGWGIVVVRDGLTLFSGPSRVRTSTVNAQTNQIELSGVDDNVWLKGRVVSPVPAGPPYTSQAYDVRTGVASTVIQAYVNANAGPGAVAQRRVPNLTMGTDPAAGSSVTGNGRWDNLLVFIQTLAVSGGIGFKIVQSSNSLVFTTFAPSVTAIPFSIDLGNMSGYEYTDTAPSADYVYVGGDGDGTARPIQEQSDGTAVATWGRIEGDFISSSGTTNSVVMNQAGNDALVSGSEQTSLNMSLIDTPTCRYGIEYHLGDVAKAQLSSPIRTPYGMAGQIISPIQSVTISLQPGAGAKVTPVLASAAKRDVISLFRDFRLIKKRLNNLERH
jgi:hypothetical protein